MKQTSIQQHLKTIFSVCVIAGMTTVQPVFAEGRPTKKFAINVNDPSNEKPAKKAKAKNFTSLNNSAVKIYPDILKRDMHVVAKDNDGREIDFFVFDVQGTLVHHYKMKVKDHYRIAGLARGTYVYRVFKGDDETATGNFEIR